MTISSSLPGFGGISRFQVSHTDLIRFWVIASITISIIGITYISMAAGYGAIVPQLFYFPILYATYFYPGPWRVCCRQSVRWHTLFIASFLGHRSIP